MLSDPIADLLTRIRNAALQKHRYVDVRFSKLIMSLLSVLREEGFIQNFIFNDGSREIRVFLKYHLNKWPIIRGLKRVSSPGRRIYVGWRDIPYVQNDLGLSILSTPMGLLSGRKARREKMGGEFLCTVW